MTRHAADTNVLARALLNDGSEQSDKALASLKAADIFIPDTVLLETEWLLRSRMGLKPAEVNALLSTLLSLPSVSFASRERVVHAVDAHKSGMDFADALHLLQSEGCDAMLSYDRTFARRAAKLQFVVPVIEP